MQPSDAVKQVTPTDSKAASPPSCTQKNINQLLDEFNLFQRIYTKTQFAAVPERFGSAPERYARPQDELGQSRLLPVSREKPQAPAEATDAPLEAPVRPHRPVVTTGRPWSPARLRHMSPDTHHPAKIQDSAVKTTRKDSQGGRSEKSPSSVLEEVETILPDSEDGCSPLAPSSLGGSGFLDKSSAAAMSPSAGMSPCSVQSLVSALDKHGSCNISERSFESDEGTPPPTNSPGTAQSVEATAPNTPISETRGGPCPDFNLSPLEREQGDCPYTPPSRVAPATLEYSPDSPQLLNQVRGPAAPDEDAVPEYGGGTIGPVPSAPEQLVPPGVNSPPSSPVEVQEEEILGLQSPFAGAESIPRQATLLHVIQVEDRLITRRDREVTIKVPEGVGADLKVRVNLGNMPEELLVPEGAKAGEVVTCDLPTVEPLSPTQQKRILHEGILQTRLRWVKPEDHDTWITDEFRKQKKHEAYRMLRGRRMGLVLRVIAEHYTVSDLGV